MFVQVRKNCGWVDGVPATRFTLLRGAQNRRVFCLLLAYFLRQKGGDRVQECSAFLFWDCVITQLLFWYLFLRCCFEITSPIPCLYLASCGGSTGQKGLSESLRFQIRLCGHYCISWSLHEVLSFILENLSRAHNINWWGQGRCVSLMGTNIPRMNDTAACVFYHN